MKRHSEYPVTSSARPSRASGTYSERFAVSEFTPGEKLPE
jgi:hypothetical protein